MQIFFKSHTKFSSLGKVHCPCRGFTLIELLISIAIIGILTSIVVVRYGSFESTTILKGAAYEIGLNLREAQVRSVSAANVDGEFDLPFGISFDISSGSGDPKMYQLFFNDKDVLNGEDENNDPENFPPSYNGAGEGVLEFTIGNSIQIHQLCIDDGSPPETCFDRLDISFKRPEYRPYFYTDDGTVHTGDAKIRVKSTRGDQIFTVTVSQLGQINVSAGL